MFNRLRQKRNSGWSHGSSWEAEEVFFNEPLVVIARSITMPKPLLFALITLGIMLLPAVLVVGTARILARKVGPRLPDSFRSMIPTLSLSLAPIAVGAIGIAALYVLQPDNSGTTVPVAVILAGVLWSGWVLFLLFVSGQPLATGTRPTPILLRLWLVGELLAAIWLIVLGFGLGVSKGIH